MTELKRLKKVSELGYVHAYAALRDVIERENRLRGQIQRIREMSETDCNSPMNAIGADTLWQTWMDRTLTELNTQLAQLLAEKEKELNVVRKAFSRQNVTRVLSEREIKVQKMQASKLALKRAIEADVLCRTYDQ